MIIRSYGLFWRVDEIEWNPGQGNGKKFRLLGRKGIRRPGLQIADFRDQIGIYILYGNLGAHYVGLTRKQTFGKRLNQHQKDDHKGKWDRFSWFGFRTLLTRTDENGFRILKKFPQKIPVDSFKVIGDLEALLIKAMDLKNIQNMRFAKADEWEQIKLDEAEKYTNRFSKEELTKGEPPSGAHHLYF
ncbi:MAG: GIY-YIG nuclease family protein [Stellaceae bacterium]